jgi:hypothetical protein
MDSPEWGRAQARKELMKKTLAFFRMMCEGGRVVAGAVRGFEGLGAD